MPTAKDSVWYHNPGDWLQEGARVRAKITVFEDGPDSNSHIHALPGELGTVIHVEPGFWPTVRFDRTRTATAVFDVEVEEVVDVIVNAIKEL